QRFTVQVKAVEQAPTPTGVVVPGSETPAAGGPALPGPVSALSLRAHPNKLRAHTWTVLRFQAARSQQPIHAYEVRVSTEPITDEASFIRDGRPAKNATDDVEGATALMLPVTVPEGGVVESAIGDLVAETHYYVGVRATDDSNRSGPISVAEIDTPARTFATVTPCFVATAAYGTPLASEISTLRRLRDRYLLPHAPGQAFVRAYYEIGPRAAAVIARRPQLRAIVRALLSPLVAASKLLRD
ncbi:MAG TPA: CFI-box-CTERM domain-containing protein, partial [Polyangiales bacterium]|nr:CFI-box-CTERM domain-containing protein [Polyangiales bacterium]